MGLFRARSVCQFFGCDGDVGGEHNGRRLCRLHLSLFADRDLEPAVSWFDFLKVSPASAQGAACKPRHVVLRPTVRVGTPAEADLAVGVFDWSGSGDPFLVDI